MTTIKYQPRHVQQLFSKSPETIRQWSMDFRAYLSVDANPSSGHRRYVDDDLTVFSHINIRKAEGASNDMIAAELANGQRATPPREPSAIVAADERSEVMLLQSQLESAQETISDLQEQIASATTRADRADGAIAYSDSLHRAEIERLERRLSDKEQEIRQLIEQNATLKAKK